MCGKWVVFALIFLLLLSGFSSVSASPPAKIVTGVVTNVVSALVKWLWSLKSNSKTGLMGFMSGDTSAVSSRSMMKFEGGYTVETVFDGSKLGIEPYSIEMSPSGDILVLDSENSNIYRVSMPLTRYSRPKLVTGSAEGYYGHVDGKLREARLNHPKGITIDGRGNIYIADTMNMAIRKISDGGVTTIAGGHWSRGGGHIDGPSEDAKFSNDFDVVYVGSSCSLLIIDRGNQAIREIQLNDDDCNYQYDGSFHLGLAVLVAAAFFGYMLALLQRRVQQLFSSNDKSRAYMNGAPMAPMTPYQRPPKSVRPPLIPNEDEPDRSDEGFFGSLGKLFLNTGSTVGEIFGGLFSGFRRKPVHSAFEQQYQQMLKHSNTWPMQESYVIPDEDEPPPSLETRHITPKRPYPFVTKEMEKHNSFKQSSGYYNGWVDDRYRQQPQQQQLLQQQNQHHQMQHHRQQHHHRHNTSNPKTYFEKSCETNEIVFGAVQEQAGRREAVVIKAVDYADPRYNHNNIRPRLNYVGYSQSHGY